MSNLGSSISPRYKQYIIPLDQSTHEFLHNDKLIWLTVIANPDNSSTRSYDEPRSEDGIHSRIRSSAPRKQSWSRSQSRYRRIGKVDEIGRRLAVRRRNPRQETQIKSNLLSCTKNWPRYRLAGPWHQHLNLGARRHQTGSDSTGINIVWLDHVS